MFCGFPEVQAIFATFFNQEQHTRSFASFFNRILLKTDSVRSANMQGLEFRDLGFVAWKCFLGSI